MSNDFYIPSLEELAVRIIQPPLPGPPDIIPGLLPRKGELVLAGETDVGKSLIALEICSCLSTGTPLWGYLKPTEKANKIVYILGEHYNEVIQRLYQKTNLPMADTVWLLGPEQLQGDKWLVTGGRQNSAAVSKFKTWTEGADLIIFDPFSAFVSGADAENDNLQMRLVLDTMSLISQSVGAACLVLAHQGKPYIDKDGKEHHKKSYAIRGASAIEDAATNIFYMNKFKRSESEEESENETKIFELTKRKYKGEAPDHFRLARDPETLTHTLLGNRPIVEVRKIETQAKAARLQAALPELDFSAIIKVLATLEAVSEQTIKRHLGLLK